MRLVDFSQTNVVLQYIACSGFALFRYDFSIALFSLIWKIDASLSSIYKHSYGFLAGEHSSDRQL